MAASIERICQKYERALKQGRMALRRDQDAEDQVEQFRQALQRNRCLESRVRQVLNEAGVMLCERVTYLNFGLRVAKLTRRYEGETLRNELRHALEHSEYLGARRAVLLDICRKVFEIEL